MSRNWRITSRNPIANSLVFVTLAGLAACSDRSAKPTVDSDLSRDLQLANQVAAQPTFQDTALSSTSKSPAPEPTPKKTTPAAARTAPRRPSPAQPPTDIHPQHVPDATIPRPDPAPAPAPAPSREFAAGTGIAMTSGGKVCTSTNRPGDKIVATIDSPVTGTNGALIPAGSKAVLEIASITPGQSSGDAQIVFRVRALYVNDVSYTVDGTVTPTTPLEKVKVANSDPNADKKKVIGGAIAGAILGQIIGHNTKGTVIGAATGAAAGAVAAKASEKYEACLPAGASLHVTLSQPVTM
jgi:hypothetical protein